MTIKNAKRKLGRFIRMATGLKLPVAMGIASLFAKHCCGETCNAVAGKYPAIAKLEAYRTPCECCYEHTEYGIVITGSKGTCDYTQIVAFYGEFCQ